MLLRPTLPPYDPLAWAKLRFPEKARLVCQAWALEGYGAPIGIYLVYAVKVALYVGVWALACGGRFGDLAWAMQPSSFARAIAWSMVFEIAGLGCGSGPLTGRYVPPIGGLLYFLRPGTTKLGVFGGHRRTVLDVALYAAVLVIGIAALARPDRTYFVALALLLPLLGLRDKTTFLAARGEHYWTTIAVIALAPDFVAGAKGIHAALWFWAGVSKLNHHFPAVVGVMTSNSPFTRIAWVRRLMYRRFPEDLRPSPLATTLGHAGTLLELSVPVVLLLGGGGTPTIIGLVMMLVLHAFITSNVPMGVPLEWNVIMVYGGFFLFGKNASVSVLSMSPAVAALTVMMGVIVPALGNVFPARVPFLLAMRYYAGNWAYSIWLFRIGAEKKLEKLTTSAPWIKDQIAKLYDEPTTIALLGKVIAFRLMHLHGRVLLRAIPRAVTDFTAYEWLDGEIVAGLVLGWNFGDGHLHREELLCAVQEQCGFEEGELRCVMVEAEPAFRSALHWRIHDAKTGLIEEGYADVAELRKLQPWEDVSLASGG